MKSLKNLLQDFRSSSKRELEENISQLYETVNKLGSKEVATFIVINIIAVVLIINKLDSKEVYHHRLITGGTSSSRVQRVQA